jgi:hypothetical protein
MSYNRYSGQPTMGNGFQSNDSIDQNPFNSPYMSHQRTNSSRSISPESSKEDNSDTLRDGSIPSMSRRESYTYPQVPSTTRPPLGLGRAQGHRTLSDLYDESPPGTPRDSSVGPPLRRPWLSASRPESEATLMGISGSQSPTPYQNSPYV